MRFSISSVDHRLYLKDGFGPFDEASMRSVARKYSSMTESEISEPSKLSPVVASPGFSPICYETVAPRVLFVRYGSSRVLSDSAIAQLSDHNFQIDGLGMFGGLALDKVERRFVQLVDFSHSVFKVIKGSSVRRPGGARVLSEVCGASGWEELEATRTRPFPLDIISASRVRLTGVWMLPILVFDRTLYVSDELDLADSGLITTETVCDISERADG